MRKYVQEGCFLNYTPSTAMTAGQPVLVGDRVFMASVDIEANTLGAVATSGVWLVDKVNTEAFAMGQKVYWDDTAKKATTTSAANKVMGYAAADFLAADVEASVMLGT